MAIVERVARVSVRRRSKASSPELVDPESSPSWNLYLATSIPRHAWTPPFEQDIILLQARAFDQAFQAFKLVRNVTFLGQQEQSDRRREARLPRGDLSSVRAGSGRETWSPHCRLLAEPTSCRIPWLRSTTPSPSRPSQPSSRILPHPALYPQADRPKTSYTTPYPLLVPPLPSSSTPSVTTLRLKGF